MVYNDELDPAELKEEMESEITEVKTLEITKAVKDSKVNGMEIKEGAYIGLCNNNIAVSEQSKYNTIVKLLESSFDDEELLTIYYGEGVNLKEAEDIKEMIKNKFDIDEVEVYNGGQPLYPYIISLE